jgi:hypothetical protein
MLSFSFKKSYGKQSFRNTSKSRQESSYASINLIASDTDYKNVISPSKINALEEELLYRQSNVEKYTDLLKGNSPFHTFPYENMYSDYRIFLMIAISMSFISMFTNSNWNLERACYSAFGILHALLNLFMIYIGDCLTDMINKMVFIYRKIYEDGDITYNSKIYDRTQFADKIFTSIRYRTIFTKVSRSIIFCAFIINAIVYGYSGNSLKSGNDWVDQETFVFYVLPYLIVKAIYPVMFLYKSTLFVIHMHESDQSYFHDMFMVTAIKSLVATIKYSYDKAIQIARDPDYKGEFKCSMCGGIFMPGEVIHARVCHATTFYHHRCVLADVLNSSSTPQRDADSCAHCLNIFKGNTNVTSTQKFKFYTRNNKLLYETVKLILGKLLISLLYCVTWFFLNALFNYLISSF